LKLFIFLIFYNFVLIQIYCFGIIFTFGRIGEVLVGDSF